MKEKWGEKEKQRLTKRAPNLTQSSGEDQRVQIGYTTKTTAIMALAQGIVGDNLFNTESGIRYSLTWYWSVYTMNLFRLGVWSFFFFAFFREFVGLFQHINTLYDTWTT